MHATNGGKQQCRAAAAATITKTDKVNNGPTLKSAIEATAALAIIIATFHSSRRSIFEKAIAIATATATAMAKIQNWKIHNGQSCEYKNKNREEDIVALKARNQNK